MDDKATLEVVIRLRDEMTRRLDAVEQSLEKTSTTGTKSTKDMEMGWDRLGRSMLNVRSIIGHVSAAYLLMRGIQTFKQMAMEAEDVAARVGAIQASWHELLAGMAQESARFWLPAIETLSGWLKQGFVLMRMAFIATWTSALKTVRGGILVVQEMAARSWNPLIKKMGEGLAGAEAGLTAEIERSQKAAEGELAAYDDLLDKARELAALRAAGISGEPGKRTKAERKDLAELMSDMERLATASVAAKTKMDEATANVLDESSARAYSLVWETHQQAAQKAISGFKKLGLDGTTIWQGMIEKLLAAKQAAISAKADIENKPMTSEESADFIEAMARLKEMDKTTSLVERSFIVLKNVAKDALQAIASTLANTVIAVFDDWIEGSLKPAREYLKQIAREMANWAIQTAFKMAANVATSAMAGGGIMKGGLKGIPTAAGGTVVRGPQLMILGDNPSREEAAVPMKNGRIPVDLGNGGGRTVNVTMNVRAFDSRSFGHEVLARRGIFRRMQAQLAAEYGEY